jgi:hypothetical protein
MSYESSEAVLFENATQQVKKNLVGELPMLGQKKLLEQMDCLLQRVREGLRNFRFSVLLMALWLI